MTRGICCNAVSSKPSGGVVPVATGKGSPPGLPPVDGNIVQLGLLGVVVLLTTLYHLGASL